MIGLRRNAPSCDPVGGSGRTLFNRVEALDAAQSGWHSAQTHELISGFPIESTDTVVDVGCGLGHNLNFCAKYANYAIGVDIDPSRSLATEKLLQNSGHKNFKTIVSDGNPLPIESASVDKIVCTEVLEHVDDPMIVMRELARIAKPGALFMLSVPGKLSEDILKTVAPASCFEKPNHIRTFSADDFQSLVQGAGLVIEKHDFLSFYQAVWHAVIWASKVDYDYGTHPALEHWARAWSEILSLPGSEPLITALDRALHKSQIIIARKSP
jgi:SAM-dependent methyltransferase